MKRFLLVMCLSLAFGQIHAQDLKIGVRAGLNFFKLQGDLEPQEVQSLSSGFHFGITGTYYFNDYFGARAEILYIQKTSLLESEGNVYSFFDLPNERVTEFGQGKYTLKRTYNTFSLPLQAVLKPIAKIEIFGGVSLDFVAGTVGQGTLDFDNFDDETPISFLQTLNFNYNTDQFGDTNIRNSGLLTINYDSDGDGDTEPFVFPKTVGAYRYFGEEVDKNLVRGFDIALTGGLAYYINPGLYIKGTFDFGLIDITRKEYDYSLEEVTEENGYIFRDDFDRKVGVQVSLGFQF